MSLGEYSVTDLDWNIRKDFTRGMHHAVSLCIAGTFRNATAVLPLRELTHLRSDAFSGLLFAGKVYFLAEPGFLTRVKAPNQKLNAGRERALKQAVERISKIGVNPSFKA